MTSLDGAGPATAGTVNEARKIGTGERRKSSSRSLSKLQGQLADLARRIQIEHQGVIAAVKLTAEHAMAAGDFLIEAKRHVAHGQWGEWLCQHCEISVRTAQLYMQLAQNRAVIEAKAQRVADLTLRGAVKAIAAQPELRNEVASQPKSPPSRTTERPKPKRITYLDLLALWLDLPVEERKHFFDAIGLRPILECAPESWKEALRRESVA
jgi:hypothetical protein